MELMQSTNAGPAAQAAEPSLAEKIKQLSELRHAGLVTDDEFEAKRQELLARM